MSVQRSECRQSDSDSTVNAPSGAVNQCDSLLNATLEKLSKDAVRKFCEVASQAISDFSKAILLSQKLKVS